MSPSVPPPVGYGCPVSRSADLPTAEPSLPSWGATALAPTRTCPVPTVRAVREPCRPLAPRPLTADLGVVAPRIPDKPSSRNATTPRSTSSPQSSRPHFASPRSTATQDHPGHPDRPGRPDRPDRPDRPRSCTLVPRKPREWDARRARTARSPGTPTRPLPPSPGDAARLARRPAPAWSIMNLAAFGVRFVAANFMIDRHPGIPSLASDRAGRRSWYESAPTGAVSRQDLRPARDAEGGRLAKDSGMLLRLGRSAGNLSAVVSGPACGWGCPVRGWWAAL